MADDVPILPAWAAHAKSAAFMQSYAAWIAANRNS
jgi:hypothetical protein